MSKILDNTTGAPIVIKDTGITVDNVTDYTIPPEDYFLWAASDDIITEINASNIVVKNGSISLSVAEGVKYIKYPDQGELRISSNDQTSGHLLDKLVGGTGVTLTELNDGGNETIELKATSAIGALLPYPFVTTGNTNDKWLGSYVPSTFSNVVPLIVPQNSDLKGILFVNQDNDVDIDIEIYKNGTLVHTEEVRNYRYFYNVGIAGPSFGQGDRMSVFLRKYTGGTGDQTAQDPVVTCIMKISTESAATGGAMTGV